MYTSDGDDVLEFKVNYAVTRKIKKGFFNLSSKEEETVILNNVAGRLESGTLTALLGASGCGKTTLLAALSQRLRVDKSGILSRQIRFNGEVMNREKMTRISGFLPQSDVILDAITVREHFYFMIELKLSNMLPAFEKQRLIENSLMKFGLNGSTKLKFLSGGEKRRVSLATELLTKPQILFCDEATSGLDSFSALSVINHLRELAGFSNESKNFEKPSSTSSRIVLLSIHQPTSDIFHLFTNIILMSGGRIIFHGTVAEAERLFTSMNLACPPRYNPAEFYVSAISDVKKQADIVRFIASKEKMAKWNEDFDEFPTSSSSETSNEDEKSCANLSFFHQCKVISHRSILNFCRDPKHYLIELFIFIVFSFVIMSVYLNISFESTSSVQDINGFLMILATEVLFTFIYAVFTLIYIDLPLLRKEIGNRLYSLSAYYISLVVMMIPRLIFETLLYTAIVYFATDVGRDFIIFLRISLAIIMAGFCSMAYGFFLSGLFESFFVGTELSGIVDLVLLLVSGMYINVKYVPWIKYISFFFYANETVAITFWTNIETIKCHPNPQIHCFHNGTEVLTSLGYGMSQDDIYKDFIYQFILTIILHILAYIGIRRNVRRSGFY